jgi:hypothetical protein
VSGFALAFSLNQSGNAMTNSKLITALEAQVDVRDRDALKTLLEHLLQQSPDQFRVLRTSIENLIENVRSTEREPVR